MFPFEILKFMVVRNSSLCLMPNSVFRIFVGNADPYMGRVSPRIRKLYVTTAYDLNNVILTRLRTESFTSHGILLIYCTTNSEASRTYRFSQLINR